MVIGLIAGGKEAMFTAQEGARWRWAHMIYSKSTLAAKMF
ncbi:Uncharacterised protein [Vibrio cholerae]|nr:Uncharacterised protein [Vibrio cholerae]